MILRAQNVTFGYHADHPVVRDISLDVKAGTVTGLFGPNGCGKSTLLRCMNGSLRPQSGRVALDGRPVDSLSSREIAREVAVVSQDNPVDVPFTVTEIVMLGRYARLDLWGQESPQDRQIVQGCVHRMKIGTLAGRLFSHLSGGERQRVILARALAQQGRIMLLDEPATHLDIAHQLELYRLVRELATEGQAILMVCHDLLIAPMFVDTAVLMANGQVLATGPAGDILAGDRLAEAFGCRAEIVWTDGGVVRARFH